MSEYKTLREWFCDATRGDGRKFAREDFVHPAEYFEPIFRSGGWHGVTENGYYYLDDESRFAWKEWHPPKKKKKLWLWAYKSDGGKYHLLNEFLGEGCEKLIPSAIKLEHTMIEVDDA